MKACNIVLNFINGEFRTLMPCRYSGVIFEPGEYLADFQVGSVSLSTIDDRWKIPVDIQIYDLNDLLWGLFSPRNKLTCLVSEEAETGRRYYLFTKKKASGETTEGMATLEDTSLLLHYVDGSQELVKLSPLPAIDSLDSLSTICSELCKNEGVWMLPEMRILIKRDKDRYYWTSDPCGKKEWRLCVALA